MINSNYYDFPIQQQQQTQPQLQSVNGLPPSGAHGHPYPTQPQAQYVSNSGSPQRRYLSEGELIARQQQAQHIQAQQAMAANAQLEYYNKNRGSNSNLLDGDGQNIRELAGSPQRGNYLWKDQSPVGNPGMVLNGTTNQPQAQGQVVVNAPGVSVSQQINLLNMRAQQQQKHHQQLQQQPRATTTTTTTMAGTAPQQYRYGMQVD